MKHFLFQVKFQFKDATAVALIAVQVNDIASATTRAPYLLGIRPEHIVAVAPKGLCNEVYI